MGANTDPVQQQGRRGVDYPRDSSYSAAESGQKVRCQHCKRAGHWPEQCPQVAAARRSNTAKYLADYERTGRHCTMCGYADHRDEDHRAACADAHYREENGNVTWDRKGSKGGGESDQKAGGQGGNTPKPDGWKPKCQKGLECLKLKTKKGCTEFWHPPSHNNPADSKSSGASRPSSADGKSSAASSSQQNAKSGKGKGKKGKVAAGQCFECGKTKEEHDNGEFCKSTQGRADRGSVLSEVSAIRETGVVTVGDMIVRNTFVDQTKGKVSEVLSWACDSKVQDLSLMPLGQLAETARNNSVMSMSDCDLEQSSYELYENPRPAGYTTQTRLHFGGIPVHTLIDSGASADVIPEEVAVVLLGYFQSQVREGKLKKNSPSYPLVAVERYSNVGEMTGISAESGGLRTGYALVLRAEFVPEGEQPGRHQHMHTISFKILPKGKSTVQGIILGTPLLDACPFGFGWKATTSTHFFEKFGIHLPRLEAQDRADYKREVAEWNSIEPLSI